MATQFVVDTDVVVVAVIVAVCRHPLIGYVMIGLVIKLYM